jgi:hypothetical protein
MSMKFSHISVIAIIFVVIAVSIAGCTSSSPAAPATSGAPASGTAAPTAAPASGTAAPAAASGPVSGSSLFGGLNYEWTEYKMSAGTGTDAMTIYYKYNQKTGKCTMRFESAQKIEGMPSEMDCGMAGSSSGGKSASNPNEVGSDVKFMKVGTESVTVGAGTFVADKYTATSSDGTIATYWIASGKPLLKMVGSSSGQGNVVMELNGWG